jgi:glycerophosphoryl diester phosphodiesterase
MTAVRALALSLGLLAVSGCGDDASTSTAGSGGSSAAGTSTSSSGGGQGGEAGLAPEDFLATESYDCRAAGAEPTVGVRPHDIACVNDHDCSGRFVMAHRMGNPFGPENSLSVLRASIALGADVAETDIRITADGRVVLIHDAEVDRTLDGTGDVSSLTLAEIQAMPMRTGSSDPAGDFGCEHAPSLEEAMQLARGRIVVELETKNIEAAPIAAAYLRDQGLYADAYIQCDAAECAAVREAVPDVPIAFRMQSLDEVSIIAALDPPPVFVEIDDDEDLRTDPGLQAAMDAGGIKIFTNVFTSADVLAATGDLTGYAAVLDRGYDMIQVELIHIALFALGRAERR